jgi:tetratricopeptide (TPR) repeat protein
MNFDELTVAGLKDFLHGDYAESELKLIKAHEIEPENSKALIHLAGAQIQLKKYELAKASLNKSIEIDPKDALAWFRLGQTYFSCQELKEAIDAFGQAITLKPEDADAWFMGGQALLLDGCINDGMTALKNALNLQPSSAIFNEVMAKNFLKYKKEIGTLIISGGIGDILLCIPFLLENRDKKLKVRVFSHFKGAERLFSYLSIPIEKFTYFSNEHERQSAQEEISLIRESYSCPKRWFITQNPFNSKKLELDSGRKTIGVQLGGSALAVNTQKKIGIPIKLLPKGLLQELLAPDRFNIILFGSADEIKSYALEENQYLKFAAFSNIDESLALVSQCDCFIGSDSSIKSLAAMLRIPSMVWLGDYVDEYRDNIFIDPYISTKKMAVFRFKDHIKDLNNGLLETIKFLELNKFLPENFSKEYKATNLDKKLARSNRFNKDEFTQSKYPVNFIITCFDKEEYLPGLLQVLESYKSIIPIVCIAYNGDSNTFPCDIKIENHGHQIGDIELTLAGYHFLKSNGVSRFIKIGIDSWLLDEGYLARIFAEMESEESAYAGNYWLPEENYYSKLSLSTDIIIANTRFGDIFEKFSWDQMGFETSLYKTITNNSFKVTFLEERNPVHPYNRFACKGANWVMSHSYKENYMNWLNYKNLDAK